MSTRRKHEERATDGGGYSAGGVEENLVETERGIAGRHRSLGYSFRRQLSAAELLARRAAGDSRPR